MGLPIITPVRQSGAVRNCDCFESSSPSSSIRCSPPNSRRVGVKMRGKDCALLVILALIGPATTLSVRRMFQIRPTASATKLAQSSEYAAEGIPMGAAPDGPQEAEIPKPWEVAQHKKSLLVDGGDGAQYWWPTGLSNTENRVGTKLTPTPFYQAAALGTATEGMITLVTQCDLNRLPRLNELAQEWQGPVSVAVLVKDSELPILSSAIFNFNTLMKNAVTVHLMVAENDWSYYPVNAMRNLGLQNAKTEWVYNVDIDENVLAMKDHLKYMKKVPESELSNPHIAFAVRSFEWKKKRKEQIPQDWDSLAKQFWAGELVTKHEHFPPAYAIPSMTFLEWEAIKAPELLPPKDAFEPYFIARQASMLKSAMFNTDFVGYRGNKVSLVTKMQMEEWKFYILPKVFTFTDEDEATREKGKTRTVTPGEVQDSQLYVRTLQEIADHHPNCGHCSVEECLINCAHMKKFIVQDPSREFDITLNKKESEIEAAILS